MFNIYFFIVLKRFTCSFILYPLTSRKTVIYNKKMLFKTLIWCILMNNVKRGWFYWKTLQTHFRTDIHKKTRISNHRKYRNMQNIDNTCHLLLPLSSLVYNYQAKLVLLTHRWWCWSRARIFAWFINRIVSCSL